MSQQFAFHNSIVGLDTEIEKAQRNKLDPIKAKNLLNTYRAGMKAKAELAKGYLYTVYDAMTEIRRFEWLSCLWEGFDTALRRLGENDETDVEKFVTDELQRSIRDYYRENSDNIIAKEKTHRNLKRVKAVHKIPRKGPEYWIDPFEDEETMLRSHNVTMPPEREVELRDECEWIESKARTPFEGKVLAGIKEGKSQTTIAKSLGVKRYRVRKAIETIKNRVGAPETLNAV